MVMEAIFVGGVGIWIVLEYLNTKAMQKQIKDLQLINLYNIKFMSDNFDNYVLSAEEQDQKDD